MTFSVTHPPPVLLAFWETKGVSSWPRVGIFYCWWMWLLSPFCFLLLMAHALVQFIFFVLLVCALSLFCFLFAVGACHCPILFSFPAGVCDYLVLISSYLLLVHALAVPFFLHLIAAGACAYFILFSFCCSRMPLSNFVFVLLLVCTLSLFCFACFPSFALALTHALALGSPSLSSSRMSLSTYALVSVSPTVRTPLAHSHTPSTHHSRTHTPSTHHSRIHTPLTSLSHVLFCCSPFVRSYFVLPPFIRFDLSLVNDEFVDRLFFIDFVCWLFDS